jgi:hypothetical protein
MSTLSQKNSGYNEIQLAFTPISQTLNKLGTYTGHNASGVFALVLSLDFILRILSRKMQSIVTSTVRFTITHNHDIIRRQIYA